VTDDEGGPAGLVIGAEAEARVGVEVLVELDESGPEGIVGEAAILAEGRSSAAWAGEKEGGEPAFEVEGGFVQSEVAA